MPAANTSARRSTSARRLLRRHVRELALEKPRLRLAHVEGRLRDAEVEHLHLTVVGHEDVLGAHVTVDDPDLGTVEVLHLVRVVKAEKGLRDDMGGERRVHPVTARARHGGEPVQGLPLEVLHREEVAVVLFPDFVRMHHVGVIEPRRHARLVEEHRYEGGVIGPRLP